MTFRSPKLLKASKDQVCVRCGKTEEKWRPVPGFSGLYEVSDQGRVRSLRSGKVVSVVLGGKGPYKQVHLHNLGRTVMYVHHAVLRAFVGEKPASDYEACHGPFGCQHNCVDNLRWDTRAANLQEIVQCGSQKGTRNPAARLTDDAIRSIRIRRSAGEPVKRIAADFKISEDYVYGIASGKRWSHVQ